MAGSVILSLRAGGTWAFLLCTSACVATVTPPRALAEPRTVYLADYGIAHTGLILPTAEGRWVEYAYGDYEWFALGRDRWYDVCGTLFWPSAGALGRRELAADGEAEVREQCGASGLQAVVVEREAVAALLADLARRYRAGKGEPRFQYDLWLVQDEQRYCLCWNCNDEAAEWLRRLGCRVTRWPILIGFRAPSR